MLVSGNLAYPAASLPLPSRGFRATAPEGRVPACFAHAHILYHLRDVRPGHTSLSWDAAERGAMTPAVEDTIPAVQSSVPLLSRRRGSLSNSSSSVKNDSSDMELGAVEEGDCALSFRVKTAGDGREYSVSSTLSSTVAQVSCVDFG